jgi:FG-GAP-like repeat
MLGDGKGGFAAAVAVPTGSAEPISNTVIADFNGDGNLDVAFGVNAGSPQVAILLGDGHGGFSAPRVITVANDTTFTDELLLLDANKDGKPDLIVNAARVVAGFIHESFLLLNDGTANFSVSHLVNAGFGSDTAGFVTTVADFNGDGFPDLLFGPGTPALIMFGDGHGGILFTSSPLLPGIGLPQGFAADIDGNQTIDLVSPSGSYFPGNGHGGFGDPISLSFPQGATLIAVADLNGDGKPDFVFQSGTSVSVILNSLTAPANISASTQVQLSLSAATTSVGLPVTLAASVNSYGGAPAGTVTFFDGAQSLGSAPIDIYGIAAVTTSFSTAGLHNNLTASFTGTLDASTNTFFGNSNTQASPSSISVNTSQPMASAPTVTLLALPNPARVLNPVKVTAVATGSSGTPTGNVVLRADGDVLALFPVGQAPNVIFPTVGLHNLQATYGGDATFPQATSPTMVEDVRLSVPGNFTVDASPQSATIKAGQTATFTITINPLLGMASPVTFGCSGLPAASSCTFSPASVIPDGASVSTTLTISTTAPASAAVPFARFQIRTFAWSIGIVFGLLVAGNFQTTRKAKSRWRALAGMAVVLCTISCGGGGSTVPQPNGGTPPGAASITVTATSGVSHSAALSVTVTP